MFQSKVIIITGASSGIGKATAIAFDRLGATTMLVARRKDLLAEITSGLKNSSYFQADLSDPQQSRAMIYHCLNIHGRIDVLINNAAAIIVTPSDKVSTADLLKAYNTNLISPVVAAQTAIQHMHGKGGMHIINVGSPGFMMGIPYYSPYVCSKAALSAWTRTIQAEWAGTDIIISEYFPGYVKTDSLPESRVGEIDQDLLMSPRQNFLTRKFAKPQLPEEIANQLVRLVRKPKLNVMSGLGVKIGTFISNIPSFRLGIARQMAITAREKLHITGILTQNDNQ